MAPSDPVLQDRWEEEQCHRPFCLREECNERSRSDWHPPLDLPYDPHQVQLTSVVTSSHTVYHHEIHHCQHKLPALVATLPPPCWRCSLSIHISLSLPQWFHTNTLARASAPALAMYGREGWNATSKILSSNFLRWAVISWTHVLLSRFHKRMLQSWPAMFRIIHFKNAMYAVSEYDFVTKQLLLCY